MRREYARGGLNESDLTVDWLPQLRQWVSDATDAGLTEPNAMVLATVAADGTPSARTVLLKGLDERGLVFFTNYTSRKAVELAGNPAVSLVFPWHPIGRQTIVRGVASQVDRADTEAYFATRPRPSQLGAWASPQSQVVADRKSLDERYAAEEARWADHPISAPPDWGGFRVAPHWVEFWQGREGRLHDRLLYRRSDDGDWVIERLAP